MTIQRKRRFTLLGMAIVALICVTWTFFTLRDDDSTPSVLVRYTKRRMGWYPDRTVGDVVLRMDRYLKKGKYNEALQVGNSWTQKYPDNEGEVYLYNILSDLYLERAKSDTTHRDEYVDRAMSYRDEALRFQSNNIYCLQKFALQSEASAELSSRQRCPQYRNAIKFLTRSEDTLRSQRQVAPSEKVLSPRGSHDVVPDRRGHRPNA